MQNDKLDNRIVRLKLKCMVEWEQSLQEIVETCIGLAKQFHVTAYLACCSVQNCMKLMGVNCADIHTNIHTQRHTHTSTLKHTHTHTMAYYTSKKFYFIFVGFILWLSSICASIFQQVCSRIVLGCSFGRSFMLVSFSKNGPIFHM